MRDLEQHTHGRLTDLTPVCLPPPRLSPSLPRYEPGDSTSKLLERTRVLQDENSKLSRELSEAAGQTALMFERIIMVRRAGSLSLSTFCSFLLFLYMQHFECGFG